MLEPYNHRGTCGPSQVASDDDDSHGGSEDAVVFRGFNGRLVRSCPEKTSPGDAFITYGQFTTFMSLWIWGDDGSFPLGISIPLWIPIGLQRSGIGNVQRRHSAITMGEARWPEVRGNSSLLYEEGRHLHPLRLPGSHGATG